jgi:Leucine Rich repeats (2 copies)
MPLPRKLTSQSPDLVTVAYRWNPTTQTWVTLPPNESLVAGTVLWLRASTNGVLAVPGFCPDPTNQLVAVGGSFHASAGMTALHLRGENRGAGHAFAGFDSVSQAWQLQQPTIPVTDTGCPNFITPGQAVFIHTNLTALNLSENQLTNLVLPSDLNHLESLNLGGNQLTSLSLPSGLTNLVGLFVTGNQLTTLTLTPDMTQLIGFGFLGNPLTTLVLPEPLAATNLAGDVATLRNNGVSVFTYPLAVQLARPRMLTGAFQCGITGPPGVYAVLGSDDLAVWSVLGAVTNPLGSINFTDVTAHLSQQRIYRALLQNQPTNMVFIPPNTFTMGSPTNELRRQPNEGPQTTVALTRGFWIRNMK